VDILIHLVVLGVFIQIFPAVISETFLLALLTAVLLKVVLELVLWCKKRIVGHLRAARRPAVRGAGAIALMVVLAGSKLLVLEVVALVFGDAVQLGDFFQVTALIIVLCLRVPAHDICSRKPSAHDPTPYAARKRLTDDPFSSPQSAGAEIRRRSGSCVLLCLSAGAADPPASFVGVSLTDSRGELSMY
jgi:hypothetical protein